MLYGLKIAWSSLKTHRLRATLAVAGVFLGALALSGVQHVSRAMVVRAKQETDKLGPNLFIVRSGQMSFRRSGEARSRGEAKTFTLEDSRALMGGLAEAVAGAPFVSRTMAVRAGSVKIPSQVVATWPTYAQVRSFHPQAGRFLTWRDEERLERVCVLGAKIAERLFGSPDAALGRQVLFFRATARVVGVMEPKGADIVGTDQDEQVFVPLSTYMRRFSNQDWITGVYIQLASAERFEAAKEAATQIMRRRHRVGGAKTDDFSVMTAQDTVRLQRQALDLVRTLGLISSSISFSVGGLGILSLMVLLVRTRRLEVGLRRAVGARRKDVLRQFILESALMSGAGGALGVGLTAVTVPVVSRLAHIPLFYEPAYLFGPLAGSFLLGVAAGAYPAWQAARLQVLEVLKEP